jgi:hypothetical protein
MSYWILPPSGIPISCNTVQRLTNLEQQTNEIWKRRMTTFDDEVEPKFQTSSSDISNYTRDIPQDLLLDLDGEDQDFIQEFNRVIDNDAIPHHDDTKGDIRDGEVGIQDPYLNMELGLPHRGEEDLRLARVKRRAVDVEGRPVGRPSDNPFLDSRQYEVEFLRGETEILTANIIAENLIAQVDEEGHRQMMIAEIEDHRVLNDAIPANDGYITTTSGMKRKRRTTQGWEILLQWKDGSSDWIVLKDLKESYPVELAAYAFAQGIQDEPAFAWWVPYVHRKRKSIIAKLKSKYWQRTHKYGIRVPQSIDEAKTIDEARNGDTRWVDAVTLEMQNV